jgi:sugar lactone lactonase YvrE
MRPHHKFTAIATVAILTTSLLTFANQSANAASNQVSILSGQGGAGEFSSPQGLSVGPDGDVYVADTDNFAIKKIEANGAISVFAKTTVRDDGWTDESFCSVYVRNINEIWASNCNNTKVFRYDRNGSLIRTYEVKVPFTSRCVNCRDWGGGLVIDRLGGIYLSDEHNSVILRIDEFSGQTTVHAGSPGTRGNSDAGKGLLNLPRGLALDSKDNLFIADVWDSSVRKVTPDGKLSTIQSGLSIPTAVAVDSSDSVYVASENWAGPIITKIGTGRIFDESITKNDPKLIGGIVGQPSFNPNAGFSIDSRGSSPTNNLYISDGVNHSIKVYSSTGKFVKKYGSEDGFGITAPGSANQIYMWPNHTFPLADGTYLVQDGFSIRHVSESGNVLKVTRLERQCQWPSGAAFTSDGTFFCALGNRIQVRFTDGTWTTIGNETAGNTDGNAVTARFKEPHGMAVYMGALYFADLGNGQIKRITRVGGTKDFQVNTILGTGIWAGGGDVMSRSRANFASPAKIAIDNSGNLFIQDGGVDSVYKTSVTQNTDITRVGRWLGSWPSSIVAAGDGVVYAAGWGGKIYKVENNKMTYFAGSGIGNVLGGTESARFNRPTGMSIDRKGNLIIADRDNQQIKKIDIGAVPNLNTSWPISVYSPYLASTSIQSSGLTAENDRDATDKIIQSNQTGLISRIYQGTNTALANRNTDGLTLCSVDHVGTVDLDFDRRLIFEGSGCNNKRYLVTYKGFITWPGSGKQSRVISATSLGGVFVKIGEEAPVVRWNEFGSGIGLPDEKAATLTLQGGKQYPIEVWYYRNQLDSSGQVVAAKLKLFWSTLPTNKSELVPISEKYFSPAESESEDLVEAPVSPSQPTVTVNLNFINLKVRVPSNATSVVLFAPEFGVTKAKPLIGKVKSGFASFEVAVSSKFAGKKGTLQLVSENAVGESKPLKIPVTVPKVAAKAAPKVKQLPKPQVAPSQPKVICKKGAQQRPFEGSCPPGWTNG